MSLNTVGFIGAGIMGRSMIRNLKKAGFDVTVYSRTKARAQALIDEGVPWADSVAECAAGRDAVITIVGYPQDVDQVYFSPGGILDSAGPGTLLIDMTTTRPSLARRIAREAAGRGLEALDAPVSGGEAGAASGTLAIMAGGEEAAFARAMPLFSAMGENIVYHGPAGSGQHCKLANQVAVAAALAGVCEAIAYARAAGLDPARVIDTVRTGAGGSAQMEVMAPKILAGDDGPSFYLKHLVKDLDIVMEESGNLGRTMPRTEGVLGAYRELEARGYGDCGTQALIHDYD